MARLRAWLVRCEEAGIERMTSAYAELFDVLPVAQTVLPNERTQALGLVQVQPGRTGQCER